MKRFFIAILALAALPLSPSEACTNLLITKGASTDGSVMITYAADSHVLYGELYKYNAPQTPYPVGALMSVYEWDTGKFLGRIPQVANTYSTVGNMNEHQLIIAESTFGGRSELYDPNGGIDYGSLIYITLRRAKTAREAIRIITDLANEHGYCSSGESISIGDANEVWILELIGKGERIVDGRNVNKGIVWVAMRIPDGYVSAHANHARITQFPKDDPENCLYSPDVISFAREAGYYNGSDNDFSFSDAYAPLDFSAMRACEARVWSFFNSVASGMEKYLDYAMGYNADNRMPLWIKPDEKLSPKRVMDAMRDHYEGTPMDMTRDIGAGGERTPYRWRPMQFEVDGVEYVNERAIATQQTGFWFLGQARGWLPDAIGGILWFGVDDAGTSCLTPVYCSVTDVPECFRTGNGSLLEYSATSTFWIFNRVAQFAYLRYQTVGKEVRNVADMWENDHLERVRQIDAEALALSDPRPLLTQYSTATAQRLFDLWNDLDKYLMVKYIDGNVKRENERGFMDNGYDRNIPAAPLQPGYSEEWKRAVATDAGERLKVVDY